MKWRQVSVDIKKSAVEAVSELLVDCGAAGVAIEDPDMIKRGISENIWDAYEFPDELVNRDFATVKAYFPCDKYIEERIRDIGGRLDKLDTVYLPGSLKNLSWVDIREEDWANSWKAYYKPVKAGQRIVIKPTWEEYSPEPTDIIIELDPGMAFGTGTHPTTVMCIRFLERIIKGGETVYDIGTGSGILAIAAAKLGAEKVQAVDVDEVAVSAAMSNVDTNQARDIVKVTSGNLLDGLPGGADAIVANIVADIIIRVCPDAFRTLKPGGRFITSGIIGPRADEVQRVIENQGFIVLETAREGEWVSFLAIREE